MGTRTMGKLSNPEKYKASDWSKLSRRARGPRGHRSSKIKRRMVQHVQSRNDLTPSAKLVGAILVNWYNEGRGYSWPAIATLVEETGLGARTVNRATAELHVLGIIHKAVGGGWDRGKIRHKSNQYYPAFSLVLELAENGGNLPKHPANMASPPIWQGTNEDSRQNSAEVPRQNGTPYGDRHMANASASPDTANASTGSPASASELEDVSLEWEEDESSEREYSIITLASKVTVEMAGKSWDVLNGEFDKLARNWPLSDDMRFGLDEFTLETMCAADGDASKIETLAGDEYDVLITRPPGWRSVVQGMPCGDWKSELQTVGNLGPDSRIKIAFWH